jgi:hypothetical protein
MLLKNISSVITAVIFSYICVFCLSILVSAGPQKCSLVWYTPKHGVAHNSMLHSQHLNFVLFFFVFGRTNTSPNSLTLHKPVLNFSYRWFKGLQCLACRMLWLGEEMDRTIEFKTDISVNLKFKIVAKKSLWQNEGHFRLVPYRTNQSNECLYSFLSSPTHCIWSQHPDNHPTTKPKHHYKSAT